MGCHQHPQLDTTKLVQKLGLIKGVVKRNLFFSSQTFNPDKLSEDSKWTDVHVDQGERYNGVITTRYH